MAFSTDVKGSNITKKRSGWDFNFTILCAYTTSLSWSGSNILVYDINVISLEINNLALKSLLDRQLSSCSWTPSWTADTRSNSELPDLSPTNKDRYTKQCLVRNFSCWKFVGKKSIPPFKKRVLGVEWNHQRCALQYSLIYSWDKNIQFHGVFTIYNRYESTLNSCVIDICMIRS